MTLAWKQGRGTLATAPIADGGRLCVFQMPGCDEWAVGHVASCSNEVRYLHSALPTQDAAKAYAEAHTLACG